MALTRLCTVCQNIFTPETDKGRFCSSRCKQAAYNGRKADKLLKEGVLEYRNGHLSLTGAYVTHCLNCDAETQGQGLGHATVRDFCSQRCKQAAYRLRKEGKPLPFAFRQGERYRPARPSGAGGIWYEPPKN